MPILLGLLRVVRSVLGLSGRYRAARWIGLGVAVWLLLGAVGRASAAPAGGHGHGLAVADGYPVGYLYGGTNDTASVIFGLAFGLGLTVALGLVVAIGTLAVANCLLAGLDWVQHRRAVRGRGDDGSVRGTAGGGLPAGVHGGGSAGAGVRGEG